MDLPPLLAESCADVVHVRRFLYVLRAVILIWPSVDVAGVVMMPRLTDMVLAAPCRPALVHKQQELIDLVENAQGDGE